MDAARGTVGPYELVEQLGQGAMGVVWLARHVTLHRPVALKLIAGAGASEAHLLARFRREAEAAARVHHPGVVRLLDYGEADGSFFLAMELVEGVSLATLLTEGPMAPPAVLKLARELLEALGACHEAGLVHRDIKPANLMRDAAGRLRVLDLGLVKQLGRTVLTEEGARVGTPRYMPPEVWGGQEADRRSDLYQAGLVLHECLSGRPAFLQPRIAELAVAVRRGELPPLTGSGPAMPALEALLPGLVAVAPADRFPDAAAALDRLTRATSVARTPRTVRVSSPPRSGGERPRASPLALALVALAALGALALTLGRLRAGPEAAPVSVVDLAADTGPKRLTLRFRTTRPLACTLAVPASALATGEVAATWAHELSLTGLAPGAELTAEIRGPGGERLLGWSGHLPTPGEVYHELWRELAFCDRVADGMTRDFSHNAPNQAARTRLGDEWKRELAARCSAATFRRALADCEAIAGESTPESLPLSEERLFAGRRELLRTLHFWLIEDSGVDPGLPWRALVPPTLDRLPEGARPLAGVRFGDGGAGAGRPPLSPATWLQAEPGSARMSATAGSFLDREGRSEYQRPFFAVAQPKEAWVGWRVVAGRDTEKLVVRWNNPDEEHGAELAFIWGPRPGAISTGFVRVEPRLLTPAGHLGLTAVHRATSLHVTGLTVDHVVIYGR